MLQLYVGLTLYGVSSALLVESGLGLEPWGVLHQGLAELTGGVATGLYIAAKFGPGPRDGLMTGLHRRTGRSIRLVRTAIEVAVVATGFVLGGTVGVGTVLYALSIGPLAQVFLRVFAVPTAPAGSTVVAASPPNRAILHQ
ncbi:hypothetical protein H1D24_10260 [Streptomyces sp. PSKA28]|uniref:Integral membrane protein n=1 Tax=Streptomyces himalayensis subsp. himalayensis TaxID=2756131 RepID=A0A7W0I8N9_9ACTN|nr:hypothetical protein [Streptomyces himalayensis subsp. himalayensis]